MKNTFILIVSVALLITSGITLSELSNYDTFEVIKSSKNIMVASIVIDFALGIIGLFLIKNK